MSFQNTIKRAVKTEGIGLHTAVRSHIRLVPAPADTGIVFRRTDLDNFEIEAHGKNVARVSYATSLMKKGVLISTTEHLLSALAGLEVDNALVEIDNLELPILDGSALPFVKAIREAGLRPQRARRVYAKVLKSLQVVDGVKRIAVHPADALRVSYAIDFPHPVIGAQALDYTLAPRLTRMKLLQREPLVFWLRSNSC